MCSLYILVEDVVLRISIKMITFIPRLARASHYVTYTGGFLYRYICTDTELCPLKPSSIFVMHMCVYVYIHSYMHIHIDTFYIVLQDNNNTTVFVVDLNYCSVRIHFFKNVCVIF